MPTPMLQTFQFFKHELQMAKSFTLFSESDLLHRRILQLAAFFLMLLSIMKGNKVLLL